MPRQLIVNADDFGRTPGIDEGILRAHVDGIVTSTTAMMNMPGANRAIRKLAGVPTLGLGVHLVFTTGQPVLPRDEVSSLVDASGSFLRADAWQESLDRMDLGELWAEWQAQLALFHAMRGKPDHLDCHHFVHLYPPIFEAYLRLAEGEGVPVRVPFPRTPGDDEEPAAFAALFGLPAGVVGAVLAADRELLARRPARCPGYFSGAFYGDGIRLDTLLAVFDRLPEGVSELMVHPGVADAELLATSRYALQREEELRLLTLPEVRQQLDALEIELVDYRVLR